MKSNKNALLVAATDTDAGKTGLVTAAIAYQQKYLSRLSLGLLKPIQAGRGDRERYLELFDLEQSPDAIAPLFFQGAPRPPDRGGPRRKNDRSGESVAGIAKAAAGTRFCPRRSIGRPGLAGDGRADRCRPGTRLALADGFGGSRAFGSHFPGGGKCRPRSLRRSLPAGHRFELYDAGSRSPHRRMGPGGNGAPARSRTYLRVFALPQRSRRQGSFGGGVLAPRLGNFCRWFAGGAIATPARLRKNAKSRDGIVR